MTALQLARKEKIKQDLTDLILKGELSKAQDSLDIHAPFNKSLFEKVYGYSILNKLEVQSFQNAIDIASH